MLQKSHGIVVSTLRYNDESFIARVFTRNEGLVSFIVKRSKSKRSAIRSVFFTPMSIIEIEWTSKASCSLFRPRTVNNAYPFTSIPFDPYKRSIAMFLAEFLHYALAIQSTDKNLYDFIEKSLEWFDMCQNSFSNFHLIFLLRMSKFLGFFPNIENYHNNSYFDLVSSQFTDYAPIHTHLLHPNDAALLPTLMRLKYETMHLLHIGRKDRKKLLDFINEYYSLHLSNFPELKSTEIFNEIFD